MRKVVRGVLCLLLSSGLTTPAAPGRSSTRLTPPFVRTPQAAQAKLLEAYGKLPLSFEPNQGQAEAQVRFISRGRGYTLFLTVNEAVLALENSRSKAPASRPGTHHSSFIVQNLPSPPPTVLRMKLVGANPSPEVSGLEELPGGSNYFIGNDPGKWRANVPNYAKVQYQGVYPGVDLVYYGRQGQLEHDFVVEPGADPRVITLAFEGWAGARHAVPLRIDGNGDLVLQGGAGETRFHKPVVYQPAGAGPAPPILRAASSAPTTAARHFVDGHYVLKGKRRIGFEVRSYARSRPLIIDPVLSYSTYLGGTNDDVATGIAVDGSGNAYVTGSTRSSDFPTANALQGTKAGDADAFVSKLNPDGTALVYSTYLGGSSFDKGTAIAVDSSGNAYVTGFTSSTNFPTTTGSFQTAYGGGGDAFVTKLNASGSGLVYSSYLGGSDADFGQGIAVDSSGNAYVTGSTASSNFPLTPGAFQAIYRGGSDAFVAKVNIVGSALSYSTYLGGSAPDSGQGIAVDAAGAAYVTGFTYSTDFPTMAPFQASNGGDADAFVCKLNPQGTALMYSTYLGGSGQDRGYGIAVDSAGNAYVTGTTNSANFSTPGAFQTTLGGGTCGTPPNTFPCADAFAAKLNPAGSQLVYSTYLGGRDDDEGFGIAIDGSGSAYVTGLTQSAKFPANPANSIQATLRGGTCGTPPNTFPCPDAFVTKLNPAGSALIYSTYLGGSGSDFGLAIALDASGSAYVAGGTASTNFPPTVGAFQTAYGGPAGDAFVAKIGLQNAPAVALFPQQINFGDQGTGSTSDPQTVTLMNAGSTPLDVTSIVKNGDFAQTNNCGVSVRAGGGTCSINVTFTPTTMGNLTGNITITDSAAGSPHQVALTGNGVPPAPAVTLSPTSLTFPDQTFGTTSASRPVTLRNSGAATLNISSIAAGGDFIQTNSCGPSLNPRASCTINVAFAPVGTGSRTGSVTITDDASGSPHSVSLTGNGLAVFSLSSSASSPIPIGTTSTTFTVTAAVPASFTDSIVLACTGGATCSFNPTSITRDQPSSTLTVSNLSASTANPFSFTATGTSGAQTASAPLSIVFQDFSLSASPPLGLIVAGQTANYTLTVTPSNGLNQTVALSCSFASATPQGTTCSVSPNSLPVNGSPATASVVLTTTSRASVAGRPRGAPPGFGGRLGPMGLLVLAALTNLLVHLFIGRRGRGLAPRLPARAAGLRVAYLRFALVALLVWLWSSCGGGTRVNLSGTPPGNYVISITGRITSPSTVTRGTSVNLSVG